MRLIDADALAMHLADWQLSSGEEERDVIEEAIRAIDEAPTADAVPVVRCKDCKWYVRSMIKQDGTLDERYKRDWCDIYRRVREETYFCAEGERRIDE